MATLPLRPPQFSDDVAWLPPWLQQPNHSTPDSQDIANHELFQNLDSLKGENSQAQECNLLTNRESKYNLYQLYLSGEEASPATLTPSGGKVLHFNLHFSADITSSIISNPLLHTSQEDKPHSAQALLGFREKSHCNIDHGSEFSSVPFISNGNYSRLCARQNPLNNDAGQNTLEILNSKCAECNDISDAVELSVAASEALVVHKIVQSGSHSKDLSASAILEVALRVKQARMDESKDSPCCFNDSGNNDILSDLGDSDMEDAYKDVGLSISILDNSSLRDPSTSRVMESPMSEIPVEDKEVQCELQGDWDFYSSNCFVTGPQDMKLEDIKYKDLAAENLDNEKLENLCRNPPVDLIFVKEPQNKKSDVLQTVQEDKNDMAYLDGLHHQLGAKASIQLQHSKAARLSSECEIRHLNHVGVNEVIDESSTGFQSRWFGGWTGMEGGACGAMKSMKRIIVPNFFACETSYLSESMDVFPDQKSVVHNHHLSSNASEAGKPINNCHETATEGAFVSQEVVKDSTAFNDPLCSMVPCSISTENGDSLTPTTNNNPDQVLDVFESLPTGTEFSAEIAETSSGPLDENMCRKKCGELDINDVEAYPLIRRQLISLKNYSLGENDARLPSEPTKSQNDKDTKKAPPVRSMSNCNQEDQVEKLLSLEQSFCCTKTSEVRKQPPFTSKVSCTTATNNRDGLVEDAYGRLTQDHFEHNAEKGVEQQVHVENIPTSPLVISRKSRRFKAPKLCVSSVSTANLLEDQAPASNESCHKTSKSSQDQYRNLSKGDILTRKRVRFSDVNLKLQIPQGPSKLNLRSTASCENSSSCRLGDRLQNCDQEQGASQEVKERLTKCRIKGKKRNIFQGLDFLLTGFSKKKEKDIEGLLRKHGGMVLTDVPAPLPHPPRRRSLRFNAQKLPVVLCTKKLQTTIFLYGCAVNAFLVKASWAYDSIRAGSVLPPDKYLILCNQSHRMLNQMGKSIFQIDNDYIFDKVGVMLHGTHKFCTKFATVVKHGRGHVHKSLQWLVQSREKKKTSLGVIVAEDENRATRHLKKCASEQKIAVVPARWIIDSLVEGKLIPLPEENCRLSNSRTNSVPETSVIQDWSQEI